MDIQNLLGELDFRAIRSSGPGGQHANKVSSKVALIFDLKGSRALNESEIRRLTSFFKNRLSSSGVLTLYCEETRSQHQNKSLLIKRFIKLLEKGLEEPKIRKETRPPKSAVIKRLQSKKKQSEKKKHRQKPKPD